MKIHYKTIVGSLNVPTNRAILENDKNYPIIEYCCKKMERAVTFQEIFDPEPSRENFRIMENRHDDPEQYSVEFKLCPFCGAPIEWVEDYRVREEKYTEQVTVTKMREVRIN